MVALIRTSLVSLFRQYGDLILVNALNLILILLIVFSLTGVFRIILGAFYVLFSPGYILVCALYPKRSDLGFIERIALSIGLSLAIVPLIGLLLNYTPWGIRLYPTLVSLALFTIPLSIVAWYRRNSLLVNERYTPILDVLNKLSSINRSDKLFLVTIIMVIFLGTVIYLVNAPRIGEEFTEFYILGPEGKIKNYPTNLTIGETASVIIGIVNHEYKEVTYRIVIKIDDETIDEITNIILSHNEKWEYNYTFSVNKIGEKMKLEFLLYREGIEEEYRKLHLWITVKES